MTTKNLARRWVIDVLASGHVFVRRREAKAEEGSLPMFSTDTKQDAESLITRHCLLERDKSGNMRINDWKRKDLKEINRAAELFRASYEKILADKAAEGRRSR